MKRKLLLTAVGLVGLAGLGTIVEPSVGGSPAALATDVERVCEPSDQHEKPSETTTLMTVTAPTGFLITGYCVKAGSVNTGDGPFTKMFDQDKWTSSVTFSHPSGKEISHYVVYLAPIPPEPDVPKRPADPEFTEPTCDAPGSFVAPPSTEALEYSTTVENGVITITVTAKPGFVVSGNPGPWTKAVADLEQLTGEVCEEAPDDPDTGGPIPPITPPDVVDSAGPIPPTTPAAGPDDVDSAGPVPPTAPAASAVRVESPPAQVSDPGTPSLPATGTSSWVLAGIALATLLAGLSLTRWSRRPDEQSA